VQFECHTAVDEPHKLKEFRLLLAIMVADNEMLCTHDAVNSSADIPAAKKAVEFCPAAQLRMGRNPSDSGNTTNSPFSSITLVGTLTACYRGKFHPLTGNAALRGAASFQRRLHLSP
jgi:hypothetical protein